MSTAEEKLRETLDNIIKDKVPNASDVKIKPISTEGANYTSVLFEATIVTPDDTKELFAKVLSMGNDLNDTTKCVFDMEKYVLTEIASAYEKIQDKHGIEERFTFPEYYKGIDGVSIIVMGNLASKGYTCYDRFKSVDWNYASKCVETLAKFHAISIAFQKEYPDEFIKSKDILTMTETVLEAFDWEGLSDAAMDVIDDEDKEILSKLLEGSVGFRKCIELFEPRNTAAIIHGDFRPSNLLHKEVNGEYDVIPVDYQTARAGCPASDLIYFILLSSDQQFRRQHFHQLVDHYYEHLALMMTKLGLQPDVEYGREEFDEDMKVKLPIGISYAAVVLPFVTVPADVAPNFESGQRVPRASELFAERFRGLMEDFKLWGFI